MTEFTAYEVAYSRQVRLAKLEASLRTVLALAGSSLNEIGLVSAHDHKGGLVCHWRDAESLSTFAGLVDALWALQGEPPSNNEHAIVTES